MQRFAPSFLDEIRERLPISEIIGPSVAWDRTKTNKRRGDFWACCPFHAEKTSSFHADDRRGRYHCFGCGVDGDLFKWLIDRRGMEFPEAVEYAASQAGLSLPAPTPEERQRAVHKAALVDANEQACRWFQARLRESPKALEYAKGRGLTERDLADWRIGYAPDGNGLAQASGGSEDMVEAGLLGEDGVRVFDRFRDRLIFPVADTRGKVVAFGGRTLSGADAKYINSKESTVFEKGAVLYNAARARDAAWDGKRLVLVEGYMGCIAGWRNGLATAAAMGTALTEAHVRSLWKISDEWTMCFDGDDAGLRAAGRAVEVILPTLGAGQTVRVALLPAGKDPDDLGSLFPSYVEKAGSLSDFIWSREATMAPSPEGRAALSSRLKDLVATIRDAEVRREFGRDFSARVYALSRQPSTFRSNGSSAHSTSPSVGRLLYGGSDTITMREAIVLAAGAAAPFAIDVEKASLDRRLSAGVQQALCHIAARVHEVVAPELPALMVAGLTKATEAGVIFTPETAEAALKSTWK